MAFIQLIEFTTKRIGDVEALMTEWEAKTEGRRTATRGTLTADRERPDTYVQIVEFPSYEAAMSNSEMPETGEFAKRIGELCEGQPSFHNLDVRSSQEF
jgi:hypothetical protein